MVDQPARTPSRLGARAELEVLAALLRAGRRVYLPAFAPDDRVDLVAEDRVGVLQRVQCKTSRLVRGAVTFRVCSNTANVPRTYVGEIDLFGVYSPELERVFLVPVSDVASRICHLRVSPPRNGQQKGIRFAEEYLLTPATGSGPVSAPR